MGVLLGIVSGYSVNWPRFGREMSWLTERKLFGYCAPHESVLRCAVGLGVPVGAGIPDVE